MNDITQGTIFYSGKMRLGRIHMSRWCFVRMQEYQLTPEILAEVFRYGRQIEANKIRYSYGDDLITIIYAEDFTRIFRGDLNDKRFTLITCWKEVMR